MEKTRGILIDFQKHFFDGIVKKDIRLIGDIHVDDVSYSELENALNFMLEKNFEYYASIYKESLILLLVKNAERNYAGSFWEHLKFEFKPQHRKCIQNLFKEVCERNGLPLFEREAEEGYNIITPFICHAGITEEELYDFFSAFDKHFDEKYPDEFLRSLTEGKYVRPHTKRYFENLGDNGIPFLIQWQDVVHANTEISTAAEVFQHLEDEFQGETIHIPTRYINRYFEWQSLEEDPTAKSKTKKVSNISPFVSLDLENGCLMLNFPAQKIADKYDSGSKDHLIWIVEMQDQTHSVETPVYRNRFLNKLFSEESSEILKWGRSSLATDYKELRISVYYNNLNGYLDSWTLPLMPETFLVFDKSGRVSRDGNVTGEEFWVMMPDEYDVESGDIRIETNPKFWPSFRLLALDFAQSDTVVLRDRTSNRRYEIKKKKGFNIPELIGGNPFQKNEAIYKVLPTLSFYETPDETYELQIEHRESGDRVYKGEAERITHLSKFISHGQFGTYDLRVRRDNRTIYKKRIYFIPPITVDERGEYWPVPGKGYESNFYQITSLKALELEIDGAKLQNEYESSTSRTTVFEIDSAETQCNGMMHLCCGREGQKTRIPFKMNVRPIVWSIESIDQKARLNYSDKPIHLTEEQMSQLTEPYLFLAAGDLGAPELDGELQVLDRSGEPIIRYEIRLKNGHLYTHSLTNIIKSEALQNISQYQVVLELYSPAGELIGGSHYPILYINPTVMYYDFNHSVEEYEVTFHWNESSAPTERGLHLFDLTRPWEESRYFPVYEENADISLPKRIFKRGIYSARVDVPNEWDPFRGCSFDPSKELKGVHFSLDGEEEQNLLVMFNYYCLLFLMSNQHVSSDISQTSKLLDIQDEETAMKLVKSYLTIRMLEPELTALSSEERKRYETVRMEYLKLGRKVSVSTVGLLKAILDEDFQTEHYEDVFSFFGLLQLEDQEIEAVNWITIIGKIDSIFPDLAFQIAMAKNDYLLRVEKWIELDALADIMEIPPSSDPIDEISRRRGHNIQEKCWASHPDYWGSHEDTMNYFSQYQLDLRRPKWANASDNQFEYLTYYEKTHKRNTKKLFHKSYLWKRQDLQEKVNSDLIRYERLRDELQNCYSTFVRPYYRELRSAYPIAFTRISYLLNVDDEILTDDIIYYAYLIMFVATLCRHGKWPYEKGSIFRNADRIRRYMRDYYWHTLVVFELYLRDGGR